MRARLLHLIVVLQKALEGKYWKRATCAAVRFRDRIVVRTGIALGDPSGQTHGFPSLEGPCPRLVRARLVEEYHGFGSGRSCSRRANRRLVTHSLFLAFVNKD